jgi:hypothetical protein
MTILSRRAVLSGAAATAAALGSIVGGSTGRAAAPPVGKQAAGWYRIKVGEFEVTIVTDGANAGALPDGYVTNASKADINAALRPNFGRPTVISMSTRRRWSTPDRNLSPSIAASVSACSSRARARSDNITPTSLPPASTATQSTW